MPVDASELEHLAVVAQSGQGHLGGLGAGDGSVRGKGAVATAGDDVLAHAVLDVLLRPVATDIGELGVAGAGSESGLAAAVEHDGDHLGHLGTGTSGLGSEAAVILTIDDVQSHHGVDGFTILDAVSIGEVRRAGSDGQHACEHGAGQSQTEDPLEILHVWMSSF